LFVTLTVGGDWIAAFLCLARLMQKKLIAAIAAKRTIPPTIDPTIPAVLNLFTLADVTVAPALTKYAFCVNVKVELAKSISVTKLLINASPKMVVVAAFDCGLRLTPAMQRLAPYCE